MVIILPIRCIIVETWHNCAFSPSQKIELLIPEEALVSSWDCNKNGIVK